ncbi:hypothetical protein GGI12_003302 [Dipsacomyces acuminosporus]|nr:hypothetical protein GGI12_003302 [Dipsacomyces acuminosporus]
MHSHSSEHNSGIQTVCSEQHGEAPGVDLAPELLDLGELAANDGDTLPVSTHRQDTDGANKLTRRERNELYKLNKRREEAYATFVRMEGLKGVDEVFDKLPRKIMCIVNIGFGAVGGATVDQLEGIFGAFDGFERVVMKHGKPYSFVVFRSSDDAKIAYANIHEKPCAQLNGKPLFLEYLTHMKFAYLADRSANAKDQAEEDQLDESHGLYYMPDFITEEEAQQIMQGILRDEEHEREQNGGSDKWYKVQERYVKHYGHSFDYHLKHVGSAEMTASVELPAWVHPFIKRIQERLPIYNQEPDQLTIQRYPAGSGISFHTDSHTSFTSMVVILSMGTPVQMDFRKPAANHALTTIDLEPRSLVLMTGEARYGWEHAIRIRRSDLVDGKVRERMERWSITMRTINRRMTCDCDYHALCDTNSKRVQQLREAAAPASTKGA